MKRALKAILTIGGSALCLAYVFHTIDTTRLREHGGDIRLWPAAAACALIFLSQYLSALRMRYYAKVYGASVTPSVAIRLYLRGVFLNLFLPGGIGGDGYKCHYLHKHHAMPVGKTLQCALAERASGLLALLLLGIIAGDIAFHEYLPRYSVPVALCVLAAGYSVGTRYITKETPRVSARAFCYSLGVQCLQLIAFTLCVTAVTDGVPKTVHDHAAYIAVFAVASAASVLPISIGGLGIRELIFIYAASYSTAITPEHATLSALLFFIAGLPAGLAGLRRL